LVVEIASVLILIGSLFIILFSCEIFTNGIEWLGFRLGLAETATGSILAAVGTAMPETIIPLIAIFLGGTAQGAEIGEGAILGAPFMLGTLAMFVGGVAIWYGHRKGKRKDSLTLHKDHAERDLEFFMTMYLLALATGALSFFARFDRSLINYGVAAVLLSAYVIYMRRTLKDECKAQEGDRPPLYLSRAFGVAPTKGRLGFALIMLQVIAALLGIMIGARLFVNEVEQVSTSVGIPAMILAFLIAPIATELPEKFNSVIWYLRSKDTLALGNVTGAMVFQSSIPVSIGLLFTKWDLEPINIASIMIALVAAAWIYYNVRVNGKIRYTTLLTSGSLYILYIVLLVVS
jgi:cation:H+ antiporter